MSASSVVVSQSIIFPATFLRLEHSTQEKRIFLWAEFRDPWFYPSSCESLPSITTIGGLTEVARLGTSQAELKDGTTRAPIVRFLSCQRAMELKPS
ncbi:BnaUnng00380D [Brassica napus]|uniref:BnaUnng00380D protein n=1 Tax=Brassica napus TaxID=3708 RepID=A0A078GSV2_BRANA|nr:BnaUnng00380D [Brassica napus]